MDETLTFILKREHLTPEAQQELVQFLGLLIIDDLPEEIVAIEFTTAEELV